MQKHMQKQQPSGFLANRVVQVHPSLRCNLACLHCYSSSGPRIRAELPAADLIERLTVLRGEGYDTLSFSGGEPLVYGGFDEVVDQANALGFGVNMVSNGLLLTERRVAQLVGKVRQIGISLDGRPERHNHLRANPKAFEKMRRNLPYLRQAEIDFGFAHCVTSASIQDLPWLLDFALAEGAQLLQLHPLTLTGRAADACSTLELSASELERVWVMSQLLQVQAGENLTVQFDVVPRTHLLSGKSRFGLLEERPSGPLSSLVNPIVVCETGELRPFSYDMPRDTDIASGPDWATQLAAFKAGGAASVAAIVRDAFDGLEASESLVVDWYQHLSRHASSSRDAAFELQKC